MYKWAVVSANGMIRKMFETKKGAKFWISQRKGVYTIRELTDEDFMSTTPLRIK